MFNFAKNIFLCNEKKTGFSENSRTNHKNTRGKNIKK